MRIDVTQSDIDLGKRQDCHCCPIALALNKAYKDKDAQISVSATTISIAVADEPFQFLRLSPELFEWAEIFDLSGKDRVKPISFNLTDLKGYKY